MNEPTLEIHINHPETQSVTEYNATISLEGAFDKYLKDTGRGGLDDELKRVAVEKSHGRTNTVVEVGAYEAGFPPNTISEVHELLNCSHNYHASAEYKQALLETAIKVEQVSNKGKLPEFVIEARVKKIKDAFITEISSSAGVDQLEFSEINSVSEEKTEVLNKIHAAIPPEQDYGGQIAQQLYELFYSETDNEHTQCKIKAENFSKIVNAFQEGNGHRIERSLMSCTRRIDSTKRGQILDTAQAILEASPTEYDKLKKAFYKSALPQAYKRLSIHGNAIEDVESLSEGEVLRIIEEGGQDQHSPDIKGFEFYPVNIFESDDLQSRIANAMPKGGKSSQRASLEYFDYGEYAYTVKNVDGKVVAERFGLEVAVATGSHRIIINLQEPPHSEQQEKLLLESLSETIDHEQAHVWFMGQESDVQTTVLESLQQDFDTNKDLFESRISGYPRWQIDTFKKAYASKRDETVSMYANGMRSNTKLYNSLTESSAYIEESIAELWMLRNDKTARQRIQAELPNHYKVLQFMEGEE